MKINTNFFYINYPPPKKKSFIYYFFFKLTFSFSMDEREVRSRYIPQRGCDPKHITDPNPQVSPVRKQSIRCVDPNSLKATDYNVPTAYTYQTICSELKTTENPWGLPPEQARYEALLRQKGRGYIFLT